MPAEKSRPLDDGFLVGVAISGYQIEGGFNGDGEPHNNWAGWEDCGRVARSGPACDFWRRPEEALDRAAAIGCNAFRLSVEWARLEPRPGDFDDAALERYASILSACAARGPYGPRPRRSRKRWTGPGTRSMVSSSSRWHPTGSS